MSLVRAPSRIGGWSIDQLRIWLTVARPMAHNGHDQNLIRDKRDRPQWEQAQAEFDRAAHDIGVWSRPTRKSKRPRATPYRTRLDASVSPPNTLAFTREALAPPAFARGTAFDARLHGVES